MPAVESGIRVLFVCTANQCRSPMAKGLFRARMKERSCAPQVASAGFVGDGVYPPTEVIDVMARRGVDLGRHRSRIITTALVRQSDVVITMTRQQLLDVAVMVGDDWSRCFTFSDVIGRGEAVGPLRTGESPATWVRQLHSGRSRASLLSLDLAGDIADPINGRRSAFNRTADQLDDLVGRLVDLVCPAGGPAPA